MTKQETIQMLQSIEDRAADFPNMTECDWVAIAAAKRHLTEEPVSDDLNEAAIAYNKKVNFVCAGKIPNEHFIACAKWQKLQMMMDAEE